MEKAYYTLLETANIFKVKIRTVREWLKIGKLQAVKQGTMWAVPAVEVDRLKNIILSSDDIRTEIFGWEDQSKNGRVFEEMNKRCKEYLSKGFNVIYNATNLNKKRRMALINEMKKYANIQAVK